MCNAQDDLREDALEPLFVCDVMLGRLARWLRILGYDTLYPGHAFRGDLLRIAREDERLLLTRGSRPGTGLPAEGPVRALRILSDGIGEQLREVMRALDLHPAPGLFRRCSLCNTLLVKKGPDFAAGKVPDYILVRREAFSACLTCGRVYWPGSHRREMMKFLDSLLVPRRHSP